MSDRQIKIENYRYGYQGQYAEKDTLTNWNSFELRMYEPRFGRWLSPDPNGQFASPYLAMGNNPVGGSDPTGGLCPECGDGELEFIIDDLGDLEGGTVNLSSLTSATAEGIGAGLTLCIINYVL